MGLNLMGFDHTSPSLKVRQSEATGKTLTMREKLNLWRKRENNHNNHSLADSKLRDSLTQQHQQQEKHQQSHQQQQQHILKSVITTQPQKIKGKSIKSRVK
jgi:hypothetical protein